MIEIFENFKENTVVALIRRCSTYHSEGDEDLALLTGVGFRELLFTVVAGGDATVGDEPAGLGGLGARCSGSLTLVPLAGELSLLADTGAAGGGPHPHSGRLRGQSTKPKR